MKAKKLGETGRMEPFTLLRHVAQRFRRLADVVLLEPRLDERRAKLQQFIARETGLPQRAQEETRGVAAVPLFERLGGLGKEVRQRHGA